MINLELSKIVPRSSLTYISALIPGLFFEVSILLGRPELITRYVTATKNLLVSSYLLLAIAVFLAFIIGNASMLFVGLIQHALSYLHSLRLILVPELSKWPLLPLLNSLSKLRFFASRQRFHNFRNRVSDRAGMPDERALIAAKTWHRLARKLLKDRYGVDLSDVKDEWEAIFWALGTLTDWEWRGPLLMIPVAVATGRTRALLREYEKGSRTAPNGERTEPPQEPGGPDHT